MWHNNETTTVNSEAKYFIFKVSNKVKELTKTLISKLWQPKFPKCLCKCQLVSMSLECDICNQWSTYTLHST